MTAPFDPNRDQGYMCPRCGNYNTEVVSPTLLWCLDCRNITSDRDQCGELDWIFRSVEGLDGEEE
jgi:hypothetical protein